MITKGKIDEVEPQVQAAVDELFEKAKNGQKIEGDYLAFLANGAFVSSWVDTIQCQRGISPYQIDSKEETWYKDSDRVNYYVTYVNFNSQIILDRISESEKDAFEKFCITSEMMIYSHIWESSRLLRIMKHLSNLAEGKIYDWKLKIPDFARPDFIRKEIRDILKNIGLEIADLISRSYHSQIRNAFAHSEYSFSNGRFENDILLWNYEERYSRWQIRGLKFEEWDERFAISIVFAHYLIEKFQAERRRLGDNVFKIYMPDFPKENILRSVVIMYKPDCDMFHFIRGSSGKYAESIISL